jgi:NDP-sugar pyrophosphorylase family protein
MADSLAGVVLAAGAGSRLAPLTRLRPKALCPVGARPLVDHAIDRLAPLVGEVAVNVHHGRGQMLDHLAGRAVEVSLEDAVALGTAGALGQLRPWIDGRAVLLTNADAWLPADLSVLIDGWDGERMRLLAVEVGPAGDFGTRRYCGATLLPWAAVEGLAAEPSGLYEVRWREAWAAGTLDLVRWDGPFVDCGTPADYLAANLLASGGSSVVGAGASVDPSAELVRSVVWPGATVAPGERLVDAVRAGRLTVLVR